MKKLLAILLVFVMILPLCVFTSAAEETVETKPFIYIAGEYDFDYDKIYSSIMFWTRYSDQYITEDGVRISAPDVGGKTPQEIAENLKPVFDARPEGARVINFHAFGVLLRGSLEDHIYMDKGAAMAKEWFDEFITHYYSIGGKLDLIKVDVEHFEGFAGQIQSYTKSDVYLYEKIVNNPNYLTRIRPQLEERGFQFWPNVTRETPEIYSIDKSTGDEYEQSRDIWNTVLRNHYNQYVSEALLDSLTKYYPDAIVCDYQARTTYAWHKNMNNNGGYSTGGNYYRAGNINYFNTYSTRPGLSFYSFGGEALYNTIPSYTQVQYKNNAFNMVKVELMWAKNLKESSPDGRLLIITAHYNYTDREGTYSGTPYYSEMLYHAGLLDPDSFQGYCMTNEIEESGITVDDAFTVISELMNELTRIVGAADRKPLNIPYTWNDSFILSGMYAGGKNYYRLTPDISEGGKVEDFQVKDAKDLTYTYRGQTISFPGGKIIEDAEISQVGTCGVWIETDKDVLPVITYSVNRNEEYPAFMETYETYAAGTELVFTKLNPANCWEIKKTSDASMKVVEDAGNKMLAMSGTYSLRLKTITENILAGDTYAENQAWEIDVAVPADMADDSDIVLLNIFANTSKEAEGGFKIAGGKIYYDNAGEYVELSGVDVSKGGKFTLKRSVDFNNQGAFTSDYFVYDADHKLLGEAKNIPMAEKVKVPVARIGISVNKIAGNPVMLDNLKLYANGLAADFELYNAKTGMEYTDLETAKDSDTAYRLSWMNGTAYEKVYSIVAAFYNGDKLVEEKVIKEIKMAPGADYVDTGIVEVPEGQTVKLYARNDSKDVPPEGDKDNKPVAKDDNMTILLIGAVVVTVVLIGLVVGVVIVLKKPAAAGKKNEETENKTEE